MDSSQGIATRKAPIGIACIALIAAWHMVFLPASAQVSVTAKVPGVCGNGVIEIDEQCEPGPPEDLGGATCESRGFSAGTLSCNADCTFNESACTAAPPPAPAPAPAGGGGGSFWPLPRIVPPRPAISPDLNGDGVVDIRDLSILLYWSSRTGAEALLYDLNGDGKLDIADISVLFYHWTDRSSP